MRLKIHSVLLLLSSLIAYLEWGGASQRYFLFQMEWELLKKAFHNVSNLAHPLVLMPLVGQFFLLVVLLQKKPNKSLFIIALCLLSTLIFFVLFIGFLSRNYKMIGFSLPYFLITNFIIWELKKGKI
jgi:hypothetical protein